MYFYIPLYLLQLDFFKIFLGVFFLGGDLMLILHRKKTSVYDTRDAVGGMWVVGTWVGGGDCYVLFRGVAVCKSSISI